MSNLKIDLNCRQFVDSSKCGYLTGKIINIRKENADAGTKNTKSEIEQYMYSLYDLTEKEVHIIEGLEQLEQGK